MRDIKLGGFEKSCCQFIFEIGEMYYQNCKMQIRHFVRGITIAAHECHPDILSMSLQVVEQKDQIENRCPDGLSTRDFHVGSMHSALSYDKGFACARDVISLIEQVSIEAAVSR